MLYFFCALLLFLYPNVSLFTNISVHYMYVQSMGLAIVLSALLQFTASDFGIFKLFLSTILIVMLKVVRKKT